MLVSTPISRSEIEGYSWRLPTVSGRPTDGALAAACTVWAEAGDAASAATSVASSIARAGAADLRLFITIFYRPAESQALARKRAASYATAPGLWTMDGWNRNSPSPAPTAARQWRSTWSPMCAERWCRTAKSAVTRGTSVCRAAASPARWRSRVAMSRAARVAVVILAAAATPSMQERPLPDLEPFLKEVRARLETDASRQFGYSYLETRRRTSIDGKGRRRDEPVTVVESYPGLPG